MVQFSDDELEAFRADAQETLNIVETQLLEIEKIQPQSDPQAFKKAYAAIFRGFHNLKGAAGMFGMVDLQVHMHRLETQFQECSGLDSVSDHITGYFLAGVDASREILAGKQMKAFDYGKYKARFPSVPEPATAQAASVSPTANAPSGATTAGSPAIQPNGAAGQKLPESMPTALRDQLRWCEAYATGSTELDFTHQFLLAQFSLAIRMFDAPAFDRDRFTLVIAELVGILRLHFSIEDHHITASGLPMIVQDGHREAHQMAIQRLRNFEDWLIKCREKPSRMVLAGLAYDFIDHVREEAVVLRTKVGA
jgi:hemerythrin/HPt (histidine-containing phosphotransfer) domain-containing protein